MAEDRVPTGPLVGLRVVELGTARPVRTSGAVLADYGAEVVVVEPPGGHPGRAESAPGDGKPPLGELWWASSGRNARSVVAALDTDEGRADVRALLAAADVVLDDGSATEVVDQARRTNAGLVSVRITPWGETGPRHDRPGDSLVAEAFAGLAQITGDADRAPLHSDYPVGASVSGLFGALSALVGVLARERTGRVGAHIDLASYEAVLRILEFLPVFYDRLGWVGERTGSSSDYQVPVGRWATADGVWMSFTGNTEDTVRRFFVGLGRPDLSDDERFATNAARVANRDQLEPLIAEWFATRTRAEADEAMAAAGVPIAAILSMAEVSAEPQYQARGSLVAVDDPELGEVRVPSPAGRFSRTPATVRHLGPPAGADRSAVWGSWLVGAPASASTREDEPAGEGEDPSGPLDGLRVLDLGNVIAGPLTATLLGDLGADVVKVERPGTGDLFRRQAPLQDGEAVWWRVQGRGKRSLALDLKDPADRDLLLELVGEADVVIENFVPGVADGLGIGHDALLAANPRVAVVSISGYGQEGPWARRRAFGRNAEAFSGMAYLTGYPGEAPQHTGFPVADSFTALFGAVCALAILYERDVAGSGRGQSVDLALYESVFRFMEPQALLHELRGEVWARGEAARRTGTWRAVLPALDGRWVTLSAGDLGAVATLVGTVGLATDGAPTEDVREAAGTLAAWSAECSADEVVAACAAVGVSAAPVMTIADLAVDEHIAARGALVRLEEADGSSTLMPAVVPCFDGRRPPIRRPAPVLGADRTEVLAEWLGRSEEDR